MKKQTLALMLSFAAVASFSTSAHAYYGDGYEYSPGRGYIRKPSRNSYVGCDFRPRSFEDWRYYHTIWGHYFGSDPSHPQYGACRQTSRW